MTKRRRRRQPLRDYEDLIARQIKSGRSMTTFAKHEGVPSSTLAQWKVRLAKAKPTSAPKALLPVRVASRSVTLVAPLPLAEFEVRFRSGHELRLSRGFDPAALRTLVEILA